jgi:hypothetical protein
MTALADAVLCRCRRLDSNQIRTIANGAFAGLTALTELYGAGLWAVRSCCFLLNSCACSRGGFRCRDVSGNGFSTITNGAFAGLTALTGLYGTGLWGGRSLLLTALLMHLLTRWFAGAGTCTETRSAPSPAGPLADWRRLLDCPPSGCCLFGCEDCELLCECGKCVFFGQILGVGVSIPR